jgi:uncharacterized protein (DUF2132 family)
LTTAHASKDPLHGVTLETLLTELVAHYGWAQLARQVEIRCFMFDPSITSSLKFLRRTPWARAKVEEIYRRHRNALPPAGP